MPDSYKCAESRSWNIKEVHREGRLYSIPQVYDDSSTPMIYLGAIILGII